ncbi:MAG: PIN domain-containing protein [Deltaproteobacteria bacterium]|nr:PIN domain-containing protein [Deltaproteobacteria bacterium]
MPVLVDTSIWIEYLRSGDYAEKLEYLMDENLIVINDLILAELVPSLKVRNQRKLIELLRSIRNLVLAIDWEQIIEFQYRCLRNGLNGIGIPDLILAQNAKQYHCEIYSLDNHFELIKDILKIKLLVQ